MDHEQPYVFFRNMVLILMGMFLLGQAMVFHYVATGNGWAAYFWWAVVTGGVPSGAWLIWSNMRARMTGTRLPMQTILTPFFCFGLTVAVSMLAAGLIYGS